MGKTTPLAVIIISDGGISPSAVTASLSGSLMAAARVIGGFPVGEGLG